MVKAWLGDDLVTPEWDRRATKQRPTKVALSDDVGCGGHPGVPSDCAPDPADAQPALVNPMLTVRYRTRTGYDDDTGLPVFAWEPIVEGVALVWTDREEFDADAGFTKVMATATLLYSGDHEVTETVTVTDDAGGSWRVLSVRQVPDRLGLTMERIDQREGD